MTTKAKAATIYSVCKQLILNNQSLDGYPEGSTLYSVFMAERGKWAGFTQTQVKDWLQGLPSVVAFPFWNDEIIEGLADNGITRKTENGRINLIEAYWNNLAYAAYMIMSKQAKEAK